jgi:hypothetical protein
MRFTMEDEARSSTVTESSVELPSRYLPRVVRRPDQLAKNLMIPFLAVCAVASVVAPGPSMLDLLGLAPSPPLRAAATLLSQLAVMGLSLDLGRVALTGMRLASSRDISYDPLNDKEMEIAMNLRDVQRMKAWLVTLGFGLGLALVP